MDKKEKRQLKITILIVTIIFIVIAGIGMRYCTSYIEKQLLLGSQDEAVDTATIIRNNFSISDEEVKYLKSLTFDEMEKDSINHRLMDTVAGVNLKNKISNVYIMALLDDDEIKYTTDASNADALGCDIGVKLNGIWLLNGRFDDNGNFQSTQRDDIYRYLEFCSSDKKVFESRKSFGLVSKDVWGKFITAYIPIYSAENNYVGILGVDIDMSVYYDNVSEMTRTLYLVFAVIMFALLVLLFFAFFRYLKMKKGMNVNSIMYQDILDAEDVAITVTDANTYKVLYANKYASELIGTSKEEYIGAICYEKALHRDCPCEECVSQQCEKEHYEDEFTSNDRTYKRLFKRINWHGVEAYLEYITDVTTEKEYLDVVEQENQMKSQMVKQYEAELQLRNSMFTNASLAVEIDLTNEVLVAMTGGSTTYTNVSAWNNRPYKEYFEYVYSLTDDDYKNEIEKLSAMNLVKLFKEGESRINIEFLGRGSINAPKIYYRSSCYISQNPLNNSLMAFVYTENIDEIYKQRRAIEKSMETGIESLAIIRVSDGETKLIKTSKRMKYQKAGVTFNYNDDFVKRSSKGVILEERVEDNQKGLLATVIDELNNNDIYSYRVTMLEKENGLRHVQFQFRYLDKQKEDIIFTIIDITEIFEEEQRQKQNLQMALDEAEKANEITNGFMSRMSHDMRTPMNGILGIAELAKDATTVEELKENIATIEDSGKYLLNLINDTLDYQKIQSGKLTLTETIVDTRAVVKSIQEMVGVTAESKGITFETISSSVDKNWMIKTDEMRLKQIFINLLSNAIKFTPYGGKVEWDLRLLSREENISHDLMIVRDTGIGMSKEFLQNGIFKPFFQEYNDYSNQYAGSGLGLSIVKNLVELMGGHIEVESELGKGTTFYVYLDFVRVEKITSDLENSNKIMCDSQFDELVDKKILVVEDNPLNAEIAMRLLEKKGCIVKHVSNGLEALDLFKGVKDNEFDAVLMDIRMPIMDGLEATKEIRALNREYTNTVPIIAMTANAFEEDVKQCMEVGMNAHIAKPVEPDILYQTIIEKLTDKN